MSELSHLGPDGRATMVDVSGKTATDRRAVASASLLMSAEAMAAVRDGNSKKGDIVRTAELAGIMAAKRTAELIPLCHPLPLDDVSVEIVVRPEENRIEVRASAATHGRTGVEMEAMTAASVAALTLYDMVKAVDPMAVIETVRVEAKAGGKSGDWSR